MTSRAMVIAFSFLLASPLALPNLSLAGGKGGGGGGGGSQTRIRLEADLNPVGSPPANAEGSAKLEIKGGKAQFEATVEIPVDNFIDDPANHNVALNLSTGITCMLPFDEIEQELEHGVIVTVAEFKVVIQQTNGGLPFNKKGTCGATFPTLNPIGGDTATATLDGTDILTGTFQVH